MQALRLASYNVHKCVGAGRRREPARILGVLNALDADIVALQETDHRFGARGAALPRDAIERETDFLPVDPLHSGAGLGWRGNAVLVRRGISARAVAALDLPGLEPRGALIVEAEAWLGPVRIVAAHLGLLRRHRRRQTAAIREAVSERPAMPTAILGDFNEWSRARGLEPLHADFRVHAPGRSFPRHRPVAALDRIALSPHFDLRALGVHDTNEARRASDHLPVWADVMLPA
jgi:endonuclease/exonuclease/phosphatase family metal-dependent hydrolase